MIHAGGDIIIPFGLSLIKLSIIKDGLLLYSEVGTLVGQILFGNDEATITVADSGSYRISGFGGKFTIANQSEGKVMPKYETFGNVPNYNYTLFEYRPGNVKPTEAARITAMPLNEEEYKVVLNEDCNIFRTFLLVAAISYLVEGKGGKKLRK